MSREICHLWFCWRKSAGYVEIGNKGTPYFKKIPYCENHGKIVREVIKENSFTSMGKSKIK